MEGILVWWLACGLEKDVPSNEGLSVHRRWLEATFIRDVLELVQPCVGNGADQQDMEALGQRLKRLEEVERVAFTRHETIPNHLERQDNPSHLRCIEL